MRKRLATLRNEHVAFTDKAWRSRQDLQRVVRRRGGVPTPDAKVTRTTTVLCARRLFRVGVRGVGTKELEAARIIRQGESIALVHDSEFRRLIELGVPARVADRVAGEPVRWLSPSTRRQFTKAAIVEGPAAAAEAGVLGLKDKRQESVSENRWGFPFS